MEENKKTLNAFALVGFILGLLGTLLYWVLAITPILAIIFSIIGLISIDKTKQKGKGLAIAGLILGIVYTGQFGLKIFLKNNNYFQNELNSTISQDTPRQETQTSPITYTKEDMIGEWQYFKVEDGSITDERIQLKSDNTFLYSSLVHIVGNDEQAFHFEFIGQYTLNNNIVTIELKNYTNNSNPEWARHFVGRTLSFEFKNGNFVAMQGNQSVYEKR